MHEDVVLGIDWGTHSSKWACYQSSRRIYHRKLPLYSSDLNSSDGKMMFGQELIRDDDGVRGLKSVLINDPLGSSFWKTERLDINVSLGEAVSFSITCLLADALTELSLQSKGAQICFSFPNWLVDNSRKTQAAAANFREAAAVAIAVVAENGLENLPKPGQFYSIAHWKELVNGVIAKATAGLGSFGIDTIMQTAFSSPDGRLRWGFMTESGAAGLPYLRAMHIEEVPGAPGLAKLLVVDVGAGSTDVGYMLRVRNRATDKEKLYYFRPASSFPVAGNELTRELMNHYRAMNQPLGFAEAEARKLQRTEWHKLAFGEVWKTRIAQHVGEYVAGIPDKFWLPTPLTLNLVLTGGSGLVPGLKDKIKDAVLNALRQQSLDPVTLEKVRTPGEHLPNLSFKAEAEYARRAVCLGASDADRPGCTYIAEMGAPTKVRYVPAVPRWV
jgi:hypothetical protein